MPSIAVCEDACRVGPVLSDIPWYLLSRLLRSVPGSHGNSFLTSGGVLLLPCPSPSSWPPGCATSSPTASWRYLTSCPSPRMSPSAPQLLREEINSCNAGQIYFQECNKPAHLRLDYSGPVLGRHRPGFAVSASSWGHSGPCPPPFVLKCACLHQAPSQGGP